MCPGEFRENSMGFLGPLTDDFIQCFQIDTLFLSLEGIDLNDGISVVDVQDGHTKKVLVEKAKPGDLHGGPYQVQQIVLL